MRRILYRSRSDRWIAGVCGGLGAFFNVDSNAIRVLFVLLSLWHGVGALVYLVLVLTLPDEPIREAVSEPGLPPPEEEPEAQRRARMLGMGLMVGGAYLLLRQVPGFQAIFQDVGVGVILIAGGILLLLLRPRQR
ncbi:MAG: PspC domain-containing protein [Armatimonadota bacterium]|nr:PspC domain-containing protein [Armatimonadota bacterium]MDR7450351.1 PspC domain-containing protein [Armatimonadota bacterium]MDR7467066.1 PspC domain-containing protein [Armatimonadota bacterium]MDR7493392.1 PspC domain-containing protein [Armatimonadota bacterium]MDR7499400.1 PspC domain-containing protein [Armatimonadota bacterium]